MFTKAILTQNLFGGGRPVAQRSGAAGGAGPSNVMRNSAFSEVQQFFSRSL